MVYLLETKLTEKKSIYFSIQLIYGVGRKRSFLICKKLGFSNNFQVINLSQNQILKLLQLIETSGLLITSELKKFQIFSKSKIVLLR